MIAANLPKGKVEKADTIGFTFGLLFKKIGKSVFILTSKFFMGVMIRVN